MLALVCALALVGQPQRSSYRFANRSSQLIGFKAIARPRHRRWRKWPVGHSRPNVFAKSTIAKIHDIKGLRVVGDHLELNSKLFVIRSGEMHYPRVPREYWHDRFRKAKAMGLNTICTYVFWNLHEPQPGKYDFSGNLDLGEYLHQAKEEGLFIILRPGPYICSEDDFGGLPSWLLKDRSMTVRSRDIKFLQATSRYFEEVGKVVRPYLYANGGPIILTQVENEYGSYGKDHEYVGAIRDALLNAGIDGQLFTADGPGNSMLSGGTLPGIPAAVNFGGDGPSAITELHKFRPGSPKMVGEYWDGWFDHWGELHHRTGIQTHLKDIKWFLENQVSFNLYMFHGGTSFGFMAGANGDIHSYQPDVTSYDYDSPLDESGRVTPKYRAFRKAIADVTHEKLPAIPDSPAPIAVPPFRMFLDAPLLVRPTKKSDSFKSDTPMSFEELGQSHGFVDYRATIQGTLMETLRVEGLRDYAIVIVDGKRVGVLDRRDQKKTISVSLPNHPVTLELVVESNARINFGRELPKERAGIAHAFLDDGEIRGWQYGLFPLETMPVQKRVRAKLDTGGPLLYRGSFWLHSTGDTFIDTSNWTKGYVWVNGHNLGRFWKAGPQQTLYLPGCWLIEGRNRVVLLDEGNFNSSTGDSTATLRGIDHPLLNNQSLVVPPLRQAGQTIRFDELRPVMAGTFDAKNDWKVVEVSMPITGRYVGFEVLSEHGPNQYASGAELQVLDGQGHPISTAKAIFADSEELVGENGSALNLTDRNAATIWHTEWSDGRPGMPHQVVVDLGTVQAISGIRYLPRQSGINGRVKDFRVFVSATPFPGQ